jgi:YHS domain-containing protein
MPAKNARLVSENHVSASQLSLQIMRFNIMLRKSVIVASAILLSLGGVVGCSGAPTTTSDEGSEASKQTQAITSKPDVFVEDGVAIRGADPVAYFQQEQFVEGSPEFEYEWMEATWRFASAENRDRFADEPERYAPQYGGYCAWAVSQGQTAPIEPTAWAIVDGKLYLNYDARIQERWQQDIPGNIEKANANWPDVLEN